MPISPTTSSKPDTDRKSDIGLLLAPKFNIESDWSRHKFTAHGNGEFVRYKDESDYDTQEGEARADLHLEVLRTTAVDLAGFYILTQDTASAVDVPDDAIGTRDEILLRRSVAFEQIIGDFTTRLKTGVSREYYGDVTLPNNVVDSNTDQNYVRTRFLVADELRADAQSSAVCRSSPICRAIATRRRIATD